MKIYLSKKNYVKRSALMPCHLKRRCWFVYLSSQIYRIKIMKDKHFSVSFTHGRFLIAVRGVEITYVASWWADEVMFKQNTIWKLHMSGIIVWSMTLQSLFLSLKDITSRSHTHTYMNTQYFSCCMMLFRMRFRKQNHINIHLFY